MEEEKGNNPLDARQPKEQAEMDGTRIDQHDMYVLGRKQELNVSSSWEAHYASIAIKYLNRYVAKLPVHLYPRFCLYSYE